MMKHTTPVALALAAIAAAQKFDEEDTESYFEKEKADLDEEERWVEENS